MDARLQTDSGKDRRLLVLLAFGLLLVIAGFPVPDPEMGKERQSWAWLEHAGQDGRLQRVILPESGRRHAADLPASPNRKPAEAIRGGDQPSTGISPRLALLLGLPFPVNRADVAELTLLQGIGPKLAANIVAYRERHGRIADAQELQSIPGIGRQMGDRIGPLLSYE